MDVLTLRFGDDDPALYGLATSASRGSPALHGRALSQHVRVSERVLPRVFEAVSTAIENLTVRRPVTAFVYPSPDTNAHCHGGDDETPVLVFVSSALVQLLTPRELSFVVGHELGHFLFRHFEYPDDVDIVGQLRMLELRRAAELSADRAGLVACRDLDAALTATLKVASGLGEAHLQIDVLDYIRQVRDLQEVAGDESLLYSTHPPFPIRARALLRFDSILGRALEGQDITAPLRETDEQIRREIDRAAAGARGNQFTDVAVSAAFWRAAYQLCSDGHFTETEQVKLSERFGRDKVEALKRALAGKARSDGLAFLEEKLRGAESTLANAPLFVVRAANQAYRGFST